MEANGVSECFESSLQDRKLRHARSIGHGDSKSYPSTLASDPYPRTFVEKLESIGHIHKRIGLRLRNLQNKHKEKLSDGKSISHRGR